MLEAGRSSYGYTYAGYAHYHGDTYYGDTYHWLHAPWLLAPRPYLLWHLPLQALRAVDGRERHRAPALRRRRRRLGPLAALGRWLAPPACLLPRAPAITLAAALAAAAALDAWAEG